MIDSRLRTAFGPWSDIWIRSGWRVQTHCVTGEARVLDAGGAQLAQGPVEACVTMAARSAPSAGARRAVVLLHGLWDSHRIMSRLAGALQAEGWAVANVGYSSMRLPLAAHGATASLAARALAEDGAREISFIGYSLGGLVARAAMADAPKQGWRAGRLVLIGSPARGSAVARQLRNMPGYRMIVGRCGDAVTPAGAMNLSPPTCREVLVIAGGTGGRGYNSLIAGDNDGLIAVAETRMPGHETAFLLVRSRHGSLPTQPETIIACSRFVGLGNH